MSAKRNAFIIFLILGLSCLTSAANDTVLQIGMPHDGALNGNKTNSYLLSFRPSDFAEANVITHGTKLLLTIYDPSGTKARGFRINGPGRKIGFFADNAGQYRLEIALDGEAKEESYTPH